MFVLQDAAFVRAMLKLRPHDLYLASRALALAAVHENGSASQTYIFTT